MCYLVAAACGFAQSHQDDLDKLKVRIIDRLQPTIKAHYEKLGRSIEALILAEFKGEAKPVTTPPPPAATPFKPPAAKRPGYLGIRTLPTFSDDDRKEMGLLPGEGMLLEEVEESTPAHQGGLRAGMVILAIEGVKVNRENMKETLAKYAAGDTVTVTVFADKKKKDFKVTLGERP